MGRNGNDKKENKAEARIAEKRRRNAERRAEKNAGAGEGTESGVRQGAGTESGVRQGAGTAPRQVYADKENASAAAAGSVQGADAPGKAGRRAKMKTSKAGRGAAAAASKNGSKAKRIMICAAAFIVLLLIIRLAVFIGSTSFHHLNDNGLTHAERFADSVVVHGIDVSAYQKDIKWKKVKSSEADFVFIRAGYRSAKTGELKEDSAFKDSMKAAEKAGIMKGAYFYSQAITPEEAEEEAEYLLDLVKSYDIEMPLAIDFEIYEGGRLDQAIQSGEMAYASAYHDIVLAFCSKVEKAGYESCVYASYDMLTNYMDSTIIGDEATIWAAQYGGQCDVEGTYQYWQCAEDAKIGGIKTAVDHDIWYIEPGRVYTTRASGSKSQTSIGDCKVEFSKDSYKLKNHRAKPKVTVTSADGKKMKKGKDYELSFVKNTAKGTGYAVIRGTGKYKDWTVVPFTIK